MRLVLILLSLCLAACGLDRPTGPETQDPHELIVLTAPPAEPLIAAAERLGYRLRRVDDLGALGDELVSFTIPDGQTIPGAIAEIEAAVPGVTAGANHSFRLTAQAAGPESYPARLIGWPLQGCRAVRKVGLIDAGAVGVPQVVNRSFTGSDAPPATDHGELMASLLVGEGRLTQTTLYSADVIDPAARGGDRAGVDAILRGLDWLAGEGVSVVNISLAGPYNKLMNRALGRAAADGMVIVAAAGNGGPEAAPAYPAAFPFTLAVTAVDADRVGYPKANHGDYLDLAAPGVDVLVPGARLRIVSGTSAAAPFVTAAIAADTSLRGFGPEAVRTRLRSRATDLGPPGPDPVYGAGLVSAPQRCLP